MGRVHNPADNTSEEEGDHRCTVNGWPKKRIRSGICMICKDESCYKYDLVDRTPKQKKKKIPPKFEADEFQELLK